jgi:TolB-like protein/Tfp pilus assembly protein PilF
MIYRFGHFELDMAKVELRAGGKVCPVEPQVFALLAFLVENRERLVSKDEIVEKVWDGRAVSDSAIASRIKSARRVLGDDGIAQRFIKTTHRQGFRFVAEAKVAMAGQAGQECKAAAVQPAEQISRPSIAVMPFRNIGAAGSYATIADALPQDLITEFSRLRWLFVTARASSFRLRGSDADIPEIGRLLGVRYCLSGTVEIAGAKLAVTVELADTRGGGVVWADDFSGSLDEVHQIREDIRSRILAALEIQIPLHEAALARLTITENLDAWSAYHLGLQHMYNFNRQDNAAATALFQHALIRDPGFARAYAGLSFIHFQTAFMHYSNDLVGETALARQFATRGMELDPIDPFVNFTMGRSFWLEGDLESSLVWLERATTISPNYAQGIYARAWTESLAGRGMQGRRHVDFAMRLSPIDPLHYAMLATRAFTHMVMGEDTEAAQWAERAARSPGAHVLIALIAVAAHALSGDEIRAESWGANARARNPALNQHDFFRAFPMKLETTRDRVSNALARCGF